MNPAVRAAIPDADPDDDSDADIPNAINLLDDADDGC